MTEKKPRQKEIDYIFSRYPLWVRYSGLPESIGVVAFAVFLRLLELMERFDRSKFYYPMEKLCRTVGITKRLSLRRILDRLVENKLIKYKTHKGRYKATEFEIILPLNTPVSEEDVYRLNPNLRSKSYQKKIFEEIEEKKKVSLGYLNEEEKKKVSLGYLNEGEKVSLGYLNEGEKVSERYPNKKIYIKRQQQQKDLFSTIADQQKSAVPCQNKAGNNVVVALNTKNLKEYGISGDDADKFTRKYSKEYLSEKIEIIEYKKHCGEKIKNIGGMLKKAIIEDWQPPAGFTTMAQREEEARKEREAKEAAEREAREKENRARREREWGKIAEEWRKTATPEEQKEVEDRARREVMAEHPEGDERWMRMMFRAREDKIIAEEYAVKAEATAVKN